jgi:poly(3-hydroxybutyrate) depolymerase
VQAAESFYKEVGVPPGDLTLVEKEGGHAFITEQGGAACGLSAAPYVSDCDYDQAKAILAWIYGPLAEASAEPAGRFILFDQQPFSEPGDGFADEGVVYVPPSCAEQTGCRVHIALHGCQQSREAVGDTFIKESGYAEIADQNRLVILFPQAKAITGINPQGCWDWWGYTGLDYLGKDAPQIAAIWAMVEQLAATP